MVLVVLLLVLGAILSEKHNDQSNPPDDTKSKPVTIPRPTEELAMRQVLILKFSWYKAPTSS